MIPRFLFMMLLIIATALTASAQQQEPVKTRSQFAPFGNIPQVKLLSRHTADTVAPKRSLIKNWYHDGIMIDSLSLGKVYRMPVDNMLCLVPDGSKTIHMPLKKTRVPERMPNAFSGRGMNDASGRR